MRVNVIRHEDSFAGDGELLKLDASQKNLLGAFRTSFGVLGVIYEVTMRVRPIRTFTASHRRVTIDKFATVVDALAGADVGFKFYLMPYRDRVYLDLRRYESDPGNTYNAPWKLKDWGESTVLPHIFKSLNRVVPIQSVRYKLIDTISEATQGLVNSRLVTTGSNAASQSNPGGKRPSRRCYYSSWCFPAANFSMVVKAYRDFCKTTYATSNYRCDMPAVGYRLSHDATSLLSPSFDESMIALTSASTQPKGWDDFVIDLAEFAEEWGGTPLISQSRALRAEHVIQTYSKRLDFSAACAVSWTRTTASSIRSWRSLCSEYPAQKLSNWSVTSAYTKALDFIYRTDTMHRPDIWVATAARSEVRVTRNGCKNSLSGNVDRRRSLGLRPQEGI